MNEILGYRAWNKYTGMMEVMSLGDSRHLGYPLSDKCFVSCFYDEEHGAYSTWSGYCDEKKTLDGAKHYCILMQFTGFKDMSKNKIYWGDIVRNDWTDINGKDIGHLWVVKFGTYTSPGSYEGVEVGYGFYLEKIGGKSYDEDNEHCILNLPHNRCEKLDDDVLPFRIVGNIYEDSKLLTLAV